MFNRTRFNRTRFNRKTSGQYAETIAFGVESSASVGLDWTIPEIEATVTSEPSVEPTSLTSEIEFTSVVATVAPIVALTSEIETSVTSLPSIGLAWVIGDIEFTALASFSEVEAAMGAIIEATVASSAAVTNFAWVYKDMLIASSVSASEALAWAIPITLTAESSVEPPDVGMGASIPITVTSGVAESDVFEYFEDILFGVESSVSVAAGQTCADIEFGVESSPSVDLDWGIEISWSVEATILKLPPEYVFPFGVESSVSLTSVATYKATIEFTVESTPEESDARVIAFAGVILPNPSKIRYDYPTVVTDTVLLSGEHSVQATEEYGFKVSMECFGFSSDVAAILGKVGIRGTLVLREAVYTDCFLTDGIRVDETDDSIYYRYAITVVRETT